MKTGLIIPCYNEEKRLNARAFLDFIQGHADYHLCFVNDGSTDNTIGLLHGMKAQCPQRISIVDVKRNGGKAKAVCAGVRYLYQIPEIQQMGFMDADCSTDFKDMQRLVDTLKSKGQLSLVFGSRNNGGNGIKRDPFRNLMSKMVTACIKKVVGLPIQDTQCGAKVFSRSIVPVLFSTPFISRWLFDVEMFLRFKKHLGATHAITRMQEIPLLRWEHVDDSKLGLKDSLRIPFRLLQISVRCQLMDYLGDRRASMDQMETTLLLAAEEYMQAA